MMSDSTNGVKQRNPFFEKLFRYCDGLVELRAIPSRKQAFFPITDPAGIGDFCSQYKNEHLYFGVGTRDGKGGAKSNIIHIPAVWCDVDFKDTSQDALAEKLGKFPFSPSLMVESGGGNHLYWLLKEPVGPDEIDIVEDVNRRIMAFLGGDPNSCDAARILRVPGTVNHKYPKMCEVKGIQDYHYELDDFLNVLPEAPKKQLKNATGEASPGWLREAMGGVKKGFRDDTGTRIAGYWINKVGRADVLEILLAWNQKNEPPLPDEDIKKICNSVFRYEPEGRKNETALLQLAAQGYGTTRKKKGASLLDMDALQECFEEKVSWLWREHIPRGMPIIVNGREGEGKTTIMIQVANEILQQYPTGIIIWIASEGFVTDTKDKMQNLNVDRNRFKILQNSNGTFQFNFATRSDLRNLDDVLLQCKEENTSVLAVFIDSIRGITPYDDNDSRIKNPMMGLNSIVCDKYRASLIYIHHFKKGKNCSLLDRNTGPTAIASSVRAVFSVLLVSQFVRKIVTAKMNIYGQDPVDLMAAQSDQGIAIYPCSEKKDPTLTGQAEQWLLKIFSEKEEYRAKEIYNEGEKFGFSKSILTEARNHLGIEVYRPKNPGPWCWKTDAFTPYKGDDLLCKKTQKRGGKKPNNIKQERQVRQNSEDTSKIPPDEAHGADTFEENNAFSATNNNNVNTLCTSNSKSPFYISKSEQKAPTVDDTVKTQQGFAGISNRDKKNNVTDGKTGIVNDSNTCHVVTDENRGVGEQMNLIEGVI